MITLLLLLVIVTLSVLFAVQNSFVVSVFFLGIQTQISLALLLIITFALGVVLTVLVVSPRLLRLSLRQKI